MQPTSYQPITIAQLSNFNAIMTQVILAIVLFVVIMGALIGLTLILGYFFVLWKKNQAREKMSLDSTLLQVAVQRENEIKIDIAEQFFASLASIKGGGGMFSFMKVPPSISFEIVGLPQDIKFYVNVPNKYRDFIEKQINAAYPDAEIKVVSEKDSKQGYIVGNEYNIFSENGKVAFTGLALKDSNYKPIKVYKDLAIDSISSITSILAKMGQGEGAVVQIIISAAGSDWSKRGRSYITGVKKSESNPETAKYSADPKELEAIENKISKPGFYTAIRLVVSSSTKEAAEAHLGNMVQSFSQLSGINSLGKKSQRFKGNFITDFVYRYMPLRGDLSILNTEELATIFHFPNKAVETPHIYWLNAKKAPAPAQIPESGLFLGRSVYRGMEKPIYMQRDDRRRHMYIIGKTGVGKSEFLKDMILQDIKNGEGVCFIDPHDTIDKLLPLIPPERAEDVILFDPSDTAMPMGLNMLEAQTEEQKHYVVSSIVGLMYKLYDPNKTGIIGPRFEHAIRNAMLTVMSEPGNTFVEVVRALTDATFVQELLPKVEDPIVRRYWTDQIAQTSDFHKSETLDYIVSKFGRFVTNKMMRNIIGQSSSAFSFRDVMDNRKILLVSLAKGKIGEENANFLGLILVPKILVAAMSRQDIPEEQRKDFYLYVDEFQNFATPDFAQILSEARKYRLDLIVANQLIGQIDEEVKNAIFGNVGTLIAFRIGVNDANFMQREFQPTFSEADFLNVDRFNAFVRTIVNGEPVPSFSMDLTRDLTAEKQEENPRVAELIRELSRLKYGKEVHSIESEIATRARL